MIRYLDIMILRSVTEYDALGDPIRSEFQDHLPLTVKFAPSNSTEPVEVGRKSVITGGTVYARDLDTVPDVDARDRVRIMGDVFEIEGDIGKWLRKDTWAIQFGVKAVKG